MKVKVKLATLSFGEPAHRHATIEAARWDGPASARILFETVRFDEILSLEVSVLTAERKADGSHS